MTREIKCRGFDNQVFHCWKFGYYYKDDNGQDRLFFISKDGHFDFAPPPESIGEFIGVNDVKNCEMYEGDIVSYDDFYWGDVHESGGIGVIEYEDGSFIVNQIGRDCGFQLDKTMVNNRNITIIGTNYENKEFLKIK